MDSNNNNNNYHSSGSGSNVHFLPTSTTSPHFYDHLSPFHLDSPSLSFPHLLSSPPPTTSARRDPPDGITQSAAPPPAHLGPTRPSKKRSRASRRVPTTVLTTDTSNFRAMVQEFTGIPAPPFSSTSASTSATSLHFPRSLNNLIPSTGPTPSFLLKPFPHKFQSADFNNYRGNPNSTPINFQSLLHSQLVNLPPPTAHVMNSNPNSGGLDLPSTIGPAGENQLGQLHPSSGPISSTADKRLEPARARGEGLMESWICSSD